MEQILVHLITTVMEGALGILDGMLDAIVSVALYADKYMSSLVGVNMVEAMSKTVFQFGVALIVLKFLKKGFEIYVLWTDGDADEEPLTLLTNFIKAMVVAISFPTLYGWLGEAVQGLSNALLGSIGLSASGGWAAWITNISGLGLVTVIFGLVFLICYLMLYFQFLMRGMEILILRVGVPIACVGLLDSDKGVFRAYANKFFQSTLAVCIQVVLSKFAIALMFNLHFLWGIAALMLALKTPKFLSDFLLTAGGNSGVTGSVYHGVRLVQMVRSLGK